MVRPSKLNPEIQKIIGENISLGLIRHARRIYTGQIENEPFSGAERHCIDGGNDPLKDLK
jgi:hypothetical protein